MKLCIFGSRHMALTQGFLIQNSMQFVYDELHNTESTLDEVVCGMAAGADTLGAKWARIHRISVRYFPANWKEYGKGAGTIRNSEMADYCDAGLGFLWDNSRGTANMIDQLRQRNKPCLVIPNGKIEERYWV